MIIYNKKTYSIGQEIKIAGSNQKELTLEQFKTGQITDQKMKTLKTSNKLSEIGTFETKIS